jgi:hypothetical protein
LIPTYQIRMCTFQGMDEASHKINLGLYQLYIAASEKFETAIFLKYDKAIIQELKDKLDKIQSDIDAHSLNKLPQSRLDT